jgi:glycosyltransferase involved in cell wall biosynthesis
MKRVSVAFDAEHYRQSAAGTARYARGLTDALRARDDIRIVEIGGGELLRRGTLRKRLTTLRQDFYWYPFAGRRRARAAGADVYHCPTPRAPVTRSTLPLVVTIHDLASLRYPETLTPWSRVYERATLRRVAAVADRVLTPSANTADDVERLLRIPGDRIRVVPNGVAELFFEATQTARDGRDPYVLFVGTPQPRKNLERLIAAVRDLRARGHAERLVIAGGDGWGAVDASDPLVLHAGRVNDEQLRDLYAGASCVALVSLHEGFGLPVIEAMAVGTPVVASRAGALPEVSGGAAVLVDPLAVSSIADGLAEAIADRERLLARGRERARAFKWAAAAERAVAVYRELT